MPDEKQQKGNSQPNPMDEENFPPNSPTRRAVNREMDEPSNVRGPSKPTPDKTKPSPAEIGDSSGGREV